MTDEKNPLHVDANSLQFFGKITASFTHELNNIISIIDQSAGLIEDLLIETTPTPELPAAKFITIASRIKKHTSRGVVLIKNLNTFSHGVDHQVETIDINHVITNLKELIGRLLSNKGVIMELDLKDQDCELRNNAFIIQQVLFLIIENILVIADKDDIIKISVKRENDKANITLFCHLSETVPQFDFNLISILADSINGSIKTEFVDKDLSLIFIVSNLDADYPD